MPTSLKTFLPIAEWLPDYTWDSFRGDLMAGLTIGVILVPQSMAYALLAGLPPIYGLYASLVPLLVYPIFGSSRHLAVGIMAIDCLIVAAGLGKLAEPLSDDYIALAFLLALMVGTIQIIMGLLRFGFVVNLLSRPVIFGFTSAAALTIAITQLPTLLGVEMTRSAGVVRILEASLFHVREIHPVTAALGLTGILLLLAVKRWIRWAPGPLFAIILGGALVYFLGLNSDGVRVVGDVPAGFPSLHLHRFSFSNVSDLFPTAVTLSLIQFMTVISLGKLFAARHRYTVRPNRELAAVGIVNLVGSFFRSLPVSGSFSRSAVGDHAGGNTSMVNIIAAVLIAVTLLFLTPLFYYLPVAVLAAIIIVAAFGLIDIHEMRYLLRTKRLDGLVALVTFSTTLLIGIEEGVLTGIGLSVLAIMYRISRPNSAVLGNLPGSHSYRDIENFEDARIIDDILILRVDASFYFANAEFLRDLILSHVARSSVKAVILEMNGVNDIDTTAVSVLREIDESLRAIDVEIYFGGTKLPVLNVLRESGLFEEIGPDRFFLSTHRVVKHLLTRWNRYDEYKARHQDADYVEEA